jgi:hypothetical protein
LPTGSPPDSDTTSITTVVDDESDEVQAFAEQEHAAYMLLPGKATQWERWVRYAYRLLRYFGNRKEDDPNASGCKLFTLMPLHGMRHHFIRIDDTMIAKWSRNTISLADCFDFAYIYSSVMTDGVAVVFCKPPQDEGTKKTRKRSAELKSLSPTELEARARRPRSRSVRRARQ